MYIEKRGYKKLMGFTMIELLVVVAIIAVLTSVVTLSYMKAQKTARNTKRTADLSELNTAVRSYYEIKNSLPVDIVDDKFCRIGFDYAAGTCLGDLVTNGFLSSLPKGPEDKCLGVDDPARKNCYSYNVYGAHVIVVGYQEPEVYGPFSKGWNCCASTTDCGSENDGSIKSYCMGFDY